MAELGFYLEKKEQKVPYAIKLEPTSFVNLKTTRAWVGKQFKIDSNKKCGEPLILEFICNSHIDGNLLFVVKSSGDTLNEYFSNSAGGTLISLVENEKTSFYVIHPQPLGPGLDPNIYSNRFNDRFSNTKIY